MLLIPEAEVSGEAMKFKLQGFPDESAVASSLERFYRERPEAPRIFLIFNMFAEQIFSGSVDAESRVGILTPLERRDKPFAPLKQD